jgi:hypothetical protein
MEFVMVAIFEKNDNPSRIRCWSLGSSKTQGSTDLGSFLVA